MRSHSEYIPLTQDQIALAQHTDIVEYLRERGEKVQKEGNHYIWEKHDSCVIHGYKWYQNSTGKHGAAVAFVQNFFHKSFPHAVLELIGNRQITFDLAAPPPTKRESKPTDMIPVAFCLPPAAPDNRRLYAYLTHTRGIAHEIVNTFIDEHLIYQDKQGNIVFVCYDCFGRVKSAHKRGTNSAQRYRGFVTGGEFNCGFSYANDNATVLYVFEAPIDLMSFLTLHRHEPWHRASYLSLGGLSEDPLRRFLKEHKSIQRIAFCFDNDINKPENRGQEAAKRFMRQFSGKYIIIQFLIGVLTPIIFIGGIIAVLNELIQSFEKKEEYNRKLEELEEEIKEFSSQNQTLVEDCKSTIREIELEHQKTIQSLSRCSQSLYNEANAVLKNTHDLMIINGLLSERIQTLLKYATTSLEPEQESKLIEEITSAINHIKMENEQIAHHRQELEKAMRDIEQHDLEVAQKQELKEIQGHHFGGLSI